jgi:hypothetical protein
VKGCRFAGSQRVLGVFSTSLVELEPQSMSIKLNCLRVLPRSITNFYQSDSGPGRRAFHNTPPAFYRTSISPYVYPIHFFEAVSPSGFWGKTLIRPCIAAANFGTVL